MSSEVKTIKIKKNRDLKITRNSDIYVKFIV